MRSIFFTLLAALAVTAAASNEPAPPPIQEWPVYAADAGASHYSPLTDLDRTNVARLRPAWEWKPGEDAMPEFGTRPGMFENTPLMIDNVLYLSTPYNRVVALERRDRRASCGPTIRRPTSTGSRRTAPASCIAAWPRGAMAAAKLRIFMNSR